ncbi:hypothetical protein OC845_004781 [Tilletia horrida]|nr:hypothetical protein OC845_004781 [Tilletia horrida]
MLSSTSNSSTSVPTAAASKQASNPSNQMTTVPFFLDRDPESSSSAKRRSLVRAGGTASSPDLRTLVNKKAKDMALAASAGKADLTKAQNGSNGNNSSSVPFPTGRSVSAGLQASGNPQDRRPSRDDEYDLGFSRASNTLTRSTTGVRAGEKDPAGGVPPSVSLADELALNSPNLGDDKGTIKGGVFRERMKKTSGFLKRLRGGGATAAVAAAAAAEPLPSTSSANLQPYKPQPPVPISEKGQSPVLPSTSGDANARSERDLPVPPRPARRTSRGAQDANPPKLSTGASALSNSSTSASTSGPSPSTNPPAPFSFVSLQSSPARNGAGAALDMRKVALKALPTQSLHQPTFSLDPELDPDLAHFADQAWGDEESVNLRHGTVKLNEPLSSSSANNATIKAAPTLTSISTKPPPIPLFDVQNVSGSKLSAGQASIGSVRNDQERRSFSPTIATPTDLPFGDSSRSLQKSSSRSATVDSASLIESDRLNGLDASVVAEKAWNEQDQFARKEKIAEWLGSDASFNRSVCTAYFKHFDFVQLRVDVAFRKLCDKLFLRAETQQVDRILTAFSHRYHECNPASIYGSADVVHSIVFSLLLLNTDLHVADIQDRMTRQQFVRNTIAAIQESTGLDNAGGGASSGGGSVYGSIGAAASASGVVISSSSPRPPHASLGESSTSLNRLSADVRNESSEFVATGNTFTSTLAAPARPARRASIRSYQGLFRSGAASSSAVNVASDKDDAASITSGERHSGHPGSPPSTSRGQYPPSAGLNATTSRRRTRSGSGTASLSEVQTAIKNRMWMGELETHLKDIYNTIKNDQIRLPMYDQRADTLSPTFARRGMRNLTVQGGGAGRVSALKRGSIRGIQGLLGNSTMGTSDGTVSPVSSMMSRSFLESSPHTPATSLSSSSVSQPAPALGFASTLSQSIIKEAHDEDATPSGAGASDEIGDDDLALMGPPWAKEGFLTRKHYYEGPHKRSKEKVWVEVFVVVQKGMMNMFQFNSNGTSTIKPNPKQKETAVVGGGNWLSNATSLGEFPLAHTLANALPPPGYNRARPHVFALTLPGGIVYLFQAGHEELVQEWVATCNYWAARQSREPLSGGVSNMEYGWNKVLPRDFDDTADDSLSLSMSAGGGTNGAPYDSSTLYVSNPNRPADNRSIRSGKSTRSFRQRAGQALYQNWHDAAALVAPSHPDSISRGLSSPIPSILGTGQSPIHANERIFINEWKAPEAPTVASGLTEEKQLDRCVKHMKAIEEDLTAHNELRQPMLQLYSPRGTNYAKALANWERKSNHLLQELVKYQCYVESLKNAMRLREEKHDLKEVDKMLATADEELADRPRGLK